MRTTVRTLAILITVFLTQAATAAQPNILYFYVDDLGWGSIGPNGQAERAAKGLPYVKTPNLDRLAREGVNFTRGYGCHVCSPARSSQQSGFHQGHTFADRNDPNNAKKAMRSDDILMGDALNRAGYATGYWGKWGYGGSKSIQAPVIENVQTLPTSHGYQDVLAELHHVRAHTFFQPTLWRAPASEGSIGGVELVPNSVEKYRSPRYPSTPALQGHAEYPATAYCDDAYCFAALYFVRQNAQQYNESGKPFFGLLAVQIPHAPFAEITTLPSWDAAYASDPWFKTLSPQSQQWAAMVTRIDAHFGNILAALEDPNGDGDTSDSVADNTLVVFQSDNGGPGGDCRTELASNANLRGTKGSIWEGGIRVPLVMRWPDKINQQSKLPAGKSTGRVVDVTDLLPTFCDLAECETPLGIDGESIAPLLTGAGHQIQRPFIIHEATGGQSLTTARYKLVSTGGQRKKPVRYELYDLELDPSESQNIASEHPDLVAALREHLVAEHVYEPRGFAVTYHHWTGSNGASVNDPDNWSDYTYENAGVQYMSDAGPPKSNWVATLASETENHALLQQDCQFLALSVGGKQKQEFDIHEATLTVRNGLRIKDRGAVNLRGGKILTQRKCALLPGASLKVSGASSISPSNGTSVVVPNDVELLSTVHNQGTLVIDSGKLTVGGNLVQSDQGSLELVLPKRDLGPVLEIRHEFNAAGQLVIHAAQLAPDTIGQFRIIESGLMHGSFAGYVVTPQSQQDRFKVSYDDDGVLLTIARPTN
ncbi:MAG: hypothetical protein Aurels2KO_37710 [Aureliella sp.]